MLAKVLLASGNCTAGARSGKQAGVGGEQGGAMTQSQGHIGGDIDADAMHLAETQSSRLAMVRSGRCSMSAKSSLTSLLLRSSRLIWRHSTELIYSQHRSGTSRMRSPRQAAPSPAQAPAAAGHQRGRAATGLRHRERPSRSGAVVQRSSSLRRSSSRCGIGRWRIRSRHCLARSMSAGW